MTVLVTGGTSLLGRSVADRLAARGEHVRLLQRSPSASPHPEILGDIADRNVVERAVDDVRVVVHLAARVAATGTWDDFERTNVTGTGLLLESARKAGVDRFVYISSPSVAHSGSALMGARAGPASPDEARGHYARSKAMAEQLALQAHGDRMCVVAMRPHLVWGPGDTQLVGRIVDRAGDGRLALVGSGTALVDTTYLDNAAEAIVAAVDRAPHFGGRALVVSNGQPRTVLELLSRIAAAAGFPPPRLKVPAPVAIAGGRVVERWWEHRTLTADPPMTGFLAEQLSTAHWFDQRETRRLLDWSPRIGLDEGFARLEAWFASGGGRASEH